MKLTGLQIRKAIELEVPMEQVFKINLNEEGDISAKEIYEDKITHTSEIENLEDIFKDGFIIFYSEKKQEIQINENLKAYVFNFYMTHLIEETFEKDSKIETEKTKEIFFLNTKIVNYEEFLKNTMDAHSFLGKFEKGFFKRRFTGVGSFNMEDYAMTHQMIMYSDIHLLDFFIKDSNIVSTISSIASAGYESDIIEQKEYFDEEEYDKLLDTVKKHKKIISKGFGFLE